MGKRTDRRRNLVTEFTNRTEHSPSAPEVDAERIAALLDGRLGERERAEVLAHLAASDEDLEAFADALAATRELEAEDAVAGAEEAGVTPLRSGPQRSWQRPGGRWLALAAAVLGLVLLPVVWTRLRDPGFDDPGRYAALLADERAGLPADWDRSPWGTTRGPGDPLTPEARAVRLGARLTELEVAVAARDPRTSGIATEVGVLLNPVPGSGPIAAGVREIGDRAGAPPEALQERLQLVRTQLAGLPERDLVLTGAWAEAARIAAARRDVAFFRTRESRTALEWVARSPEPARSAAERVRGAVTSDGTPDWASLERGLADLLRALGS